jgi:hypothetical protein
MGISPPALGGAALVGGAAGTIIRLTGTTSGNGVASGAPELVSGRPPGGGGGGGAMGPTASGDSDEAVA